MIPVIHLLSVDVCTTLQENRQCVINSNARSQYHLGCVMNFVVMKLINIKDGVCDLILLINVLLQYGDFVSY